jgi:protein SCO1/2
MPPLLSPAPLHPTSPESPEHPAERPRLWARLVVGLTGLGLVGAALAAGFFARGRAPGPVLPPDQERALTGFALTDRTGRSVTRAELEGKFCVVGFVFTSCGSTCAEVSRRMAQVQRLVQGQADVRLVSLTVDPRSDTPPVLAKFAARFGADTNRWLFLTGDKEVLFPLIETSFLPKDTLGGYQPQPGEFLHTDRIALVDPNGRVRAYFEGLKDETPTVLVAELNRLRQELSPR